MSAIDPRFLGERRRGADRKLSPTKEIEVTRDYVGGVKLAEIAEKFGISRPTIYEILTRNGIAVKTTETEKPPHSQEVNGG